MKDISPGKIRSMKRGMVIAIPLLLAVPAALIFLFQALGYAVEWGAFGLGAAGWVLALMLRTPVILLARKLGEQRGQTLVVLSSGLMEEGVRLVMLLLLSTAFSYSLSFGQGWAAIEVIYAIISGIAMMSLYEKTDEKAMEAKEMLAAQGHRPTHPLWGVPERVFASFFHIGAALLLAKSAWLVLLLIPVHSFFNLFMVRLSKRSIALAELFIAVIGTSLLLWGWYA
ncbi:hypothetical protein RAC89_12840 [Paenibacillus sp. GD4]|uniref:hypothetical protein n=1 Tax=Paenibacillus sp. GD4 TaxID=3068890 RepID=UPI0027967D6B|nr:hypothetical protein [Paenibacillus sp. GD4]MDQ1911334.1 hypothetical protein [Paenibacillus sp. GD4]